MSDSDTSGEDVWLSLRQASEKMGVSAATLRVWADEGRVQSYRTPGGHRRFRVGDAAIPLKPEKRGAVTRWRLLENSALGRLQMASETTEGGQLVIPPQAREEQRSLERQLVSLCTQGLSRHHADFDARVIAVGRAFAKYHWRYGIPTRDALNMLGTFRIAFVESVVEFAFGIGDPGVDELNLWLRRVNEIIDRVCLSMLEYRTEDKAGHGGKG
jgi:excisionase family DNA binding protein